MFGDSPRFTRSSVTSDPAVSPMVIASTKFPGIPIPQCRASDARRGIYVNPHTLESLRITLQHFEQSTDPSLVHEDLALLRRILLNRIAELESTSTREFPPLDRVQPL
jgi:hypothetical protein